MSEKPWPADKVERWPIEKLIPYARNARAHDDGQIAQIAASISEFGFTVPVIVSKDGEIIAGHGRVLAARKLFLKEVPVVVVHDWTETQRKAYRLLDNRVPLNSTWDNELLQLELQDLDKSDFTLALTGFSDLEIESFLGDPITSDDPEKEWQGMPEFSHQDLTSAHKIIVHFANADDMKSFAELIGQNITESTRSIWHPPAEIGRYADKRYAAEPIGDDEP